MLFLITVIAQLKCWIVRNHEIVDRAPGCKLNFFACYWKRTPKMNSVSPFLERGRVTRPPSPILKVKVFFKQFNNHNIQQATSVYRAISILNNCIALNCFHFLPKRDYLLGSKKS